MLQRYVIVVALASLGLQQTTTEETQMKRKERPLKMTENRDVHTMDVLTVVVTEAPSVAPLPRLAEAPLGPN